MQYLLKQNSKAQAGRHPDTRKVHHHGLWSISPNEEWCIDGHEKIKNLIEIAIWGIIDKCSQVELRLWAMPDTRVLEMPPALYLHLVKERKGKQIWILFYQSIQVQVVWECPCPQWVTKEVNSDFSLLSLLLWDNCDIIYWWSSLWLSSMIILGIKCSHFSWKISFLPSRWWRVFIISLTRGGGDQSGKKNLGMWPMNINLEWLMHL